MTRGHTDLLRTFGFANAHTLSPATVRQLLPQVIERRVLRRSSSWQEWLEFCDAFPKTPNVSYRVLLDEAYLRRGQ